MNDISTIKQQDSAIVYKSKDDDGIAVAYSHGRMQWYRVDTRYYINIEDYKYWRPL